MSDTMVVPLGPSKAQLRNLATDNIERMEDDPGLLNGWLAWLPEVVKDISRVEVGVFRCPSGEITCDEGCCGGPGCECCENAGLWESPLNGDLMTWEPECGYCCRKALLVEVVGVIDYTMLLAA